MKLLIHDLPPEIFSRLGIPGNDTAVIAAEGKYAPCQGCYDCWLKTPGYCRIQDGFQHIGALSGQSSEVILLSENWYGGYSAPVKNALDRGISASTPFFTRRGGTLRHGRRYATARRLAVFFYGDSTDEEKETAKALVEANRQNGGYKSAAVFFADTPEDAAEALRCGY